MSLLDLLFPKYCLGCGRFNQYLCQECLEKVIPLEKQICPICKKSSINGFTHSCCRSRFSLDGLISIFPYEGILKKAIIKLKYKFVTDLAFELAIKIIQAIEKDKKSRFKYLNYLIKNKKKVVILPVPLHRYRENWRGFNQAELLARKIAHYFGWRLGVDILIRQKFTHSQISLKAGGRQKNIQGAFCLNSKWKLKNRNWKFIIFDDVWTTGSTLKEAGKILKKEGVKEVWGLTICR